MELSLGNEVLQLMQGRLEHLDIRRIFLNIIFNLCIIIFTSKSL